MTADDRRVIVLDDPDWHQGVVGIVCSRLVERFGRPAVLLQRTEGLCKGSARSIEGYSIHDGLLTCAEHLERFGGHDMAAGLSLEPDQLDAFTAALTAHANAHIAVEQLTPTIDLDCDASLAELDHAAVDRLAQLRPFGRANRAPTLRVAHATIADAPRTIGAHGKHLSFRIRQDDPAGRRRILRCVWWNAGDHADRLAAGMPLDLAVEPKLNTWQGRTSVELDVRDLRLP